MDFSCASLLLVGLAPVPAKVCGTRLGHRARSCELPQGRRRDHSQPTRVCVRTTCGLGTGGGGKGADLDEDEVLPIPPTGMWRVSVYIYIYIHTYIYIYISLSLSLSIHIYIYILSGRRPWIASGERSRVRQHLATQALLSKCEFFIYMYITIYIYIYIYIYVYVYDQRIGCRRVHRVLLSNGPPEEDLNPALLFRSYALESKYGESNPCAAKMHTKEEGSRDFASSKSIAAWDVFPLDSKSSSDLSTRDSQILCPADC